MGKTGIVAVMFVVLALTGCAATPAPPAGADAYLTSVKGVWYGAAPSDADLIAYGEKACSALTSGAAIPDVSVVPGASSVAVSLTSTGTDKNNWHVVRFAPAMCP